MTLTIADCTEKKQWNAYVQKHGTIFHRYEWGEILEKVYGYKPYYRGLFNKNKLVGCMLTVAHGRLGGRRLSSIPFVDFAGPLADTDEHREMLYADAIDLYTSDHKNGLTVQTTTPLHTCDLPLSQSDPFCHFILDVDRPYEVVRTESIHQKTRNILNKALKGGIMTQREDPADCFNDYYKMYAKTLLKLKSLPHTKAYMRAVFDAFKDELRIFSASQNDKTGAYIAAFEFGDTLTIWGNASTPSFAKRGANAAAYDAAIQYACGKKNLHHVDFGSTVPDTPHHFFKKRWGGVEHLIYVVQYGEKSLPHSTGGLQQAVVSILRKFPAAIRQRAARIIYRHY